jgi:hypothetical protein
MKGVGHNSQIIGMTMPVQAVQLTGEPSGGKIQHQNHKLNVVIV